MRLWWPTIGPLAVVSSFLIRPGNPLSTLAVVAIFIIFLLQTRRYAAAIIGGAGIGLLVWGLPARLRAAFGLKDAAHGSNFWAVIYPLVSPQPNGWPDVYRIFSENSTGIPRDTLAWGEPVRAASIVEPFAGPFYAVKSFSWNLMLILDSGWINPALPLPGNSPQFQLFTINWWVQQEGILPVILSFASIVFWVGSWISLVITINWCFRNLSNAFNK